MITGFFAGLIDSMAGGGGLIAVPVLLYTGIAPATVLGTNRLQSCVGELNAIIHFIKKQQLSLKKLISGIFYTAIGSTLGTLLVQIIHPLILQKLIPILLIFVLIYTVTSSGFRKKSIRPKLPEKLFLCYFGLLIGFYNGFFGPGTGSFWLAGFMFFLAYPIVQATTHAKPLNLTGNVVSLVWFALGGHIQYLYAFLMALGQVAGSSIGARLVIYKGHILIRPLFVIVVTIMSVDLLIKNYF